MGFSLYHYTDRNGKNAIEASGKIYGSTSTYWEQNDAQYGNGVYFTGLGPRNRSDDIMGNNWDGSTTPYEFRRRVEWFFEFDVEDLPGIFQVKEAADNNRDVWLYPYAYVECYQHAGRRNMNL